MGQKKINITLAVMIGLISTSILAEESNGIAQESATQAVALGTGSPDEAEAEQQGNDSKLSPDLYRLKLLAERQSSVQTRSARSKRDVSGAAQIAPLNLDIIIEGSLDSLRGELSAAGFNVQAAYGNSVGGTLAPENLQALSDIPQVRRINMPEIGANAGLVENQADFVQLSRRVKSSLQNPPTGKGITVGVLSTSYNCLNKIKNPKMPDITEADDINNGEVPNDVYVVKEVGKCYTSSNDEGRAMIQLIHDIAPDAKIAFYGPDSITDFAQGIQTLALPKGQFDAFGREGAGADVIVDDLYFHAEPFFEIGLVGESIRQVVAKGVPYFATAGNTTKNGNGGIYSNTHPQFVPYAPARDSAYRGNNAKILKVGDGENDTILPVTLKNNGTQRIGIWWNQSYAGGNQSDMVACLTQQSGKRISSSNWCVRQPLGQDPMILLSITLPDAAPSGVYGIQLFHNGGVTPGIIKVMGFKQAAVDSLGTLSGTVKGHSATPEAFTLGAADFAKTPQCSTTAIEVKMESFSSHGNTPLLFDSAGKSIYLIPNKPDATAIDGVSTSFFSSAIPAADKLPVFKDPACDYTSPYAFYGTSAAAPDAAATAALILQDNPGMTPKALYQVLKQTATPVGASPEEGNYNYVSGSGLINAEKAITTLRAARGL